jgi:hypothetical protein
MSHQVIPAQDSTEYEEGRLLWSDFAPWNLNNSAQSGQTAVVNILHFDSPSHGGESNNA